MTKAPKVAAQFNRAKISSKGFAEAEDYLNAYSDELSETLGEPSSARPLLLMPGRFTPTRGGVEKLATSKLTVNSAREDSSLRNEAVAHSDYDRKPTQSVENRGTGFLTKSKPFNILSEAIPIATFLAMCAKMKKHCTTRFSV